MEVRLKHVVGGELRNPAKKTTTAQDGLPLRYSLRSSSHEDFFFLISSIIKNYTYGKPSKVTAIHLSKYVCEKEKIGVELQWTVINL